MKRPEPQLLHGDCMAVLPTLPADSVHCVVTSPPYFALRSYLPKDHPDKAKEIGSEVSPEAFISTMVSVFREVRRVMHPSGSLWINLGDSYGTGTTAPRKSGNRGISQSTQAAQDAMPRLGGEACQLLNIPHRVAEALRADGWIWRQTIVWQKPSPMPESVNGWRWTKCKVKIAPGAMPRRSDNLELRRELHSQLHGEMPPTAQWSDCPGCPRCLPNGGYVLRKGKGRCTTAHEYLFLFAKSPSYFYDSAAAVEKATCDRKRGPAEHPCKDTNGNGGLSHRDIHATRNYRSVWSINSEPTSEKHFAAYPSALVHKILKAGASAGGCCAECGMPWAAVVESDRQPTRPAHESKTYIDPENSPYKSHSGSIVGNRDPQRHCTVSRTLAYRPTCTCTAPSTPCTVLDPFAGTATTLQTAKWLGHASIGIELNPEYIAIAERRLQQPPRWWKKLHEKPNGKVVKVANGQRELFV